MFRIKLLVLIILACLPIACSPIASSPISLTHMHLALTFRPDVQFAPVYVAIEKGYFSAEGWEIDLDYPDEPQSTALVGANELQFAVVSGEQVLLARSQGLPVVYVAAWYQQYPVSIISKVEQNIVTPPDLRGKTIGLPGLFGASYIGLRALLHVGGLSEADVMLDSISYTQPEALVTDRDQAVVVYTTNEPIQLRAENYELNEIRVADYVHLVSNGLITNETTISENPNLVRGMLRAFLRGLQDTIENPDEAYEICKTYVENLNQVDELVQKNVLATSIELWQSDQLGYSDLQAWENMQDVLLDMGLLTKSLDLAAAFTNGLLP